MNIENLQFPIGKFEPNATPNQALFLEWVEEIAIFPEKLKALTKNANQQQLNFRYRPNGWTVKQVIHHCADSHINGFVRVKLALTEPTPTIKPYLEASWAKLVDSQDDNISFSIKILEGIHYKWAKLLKSLDNEQLNLCFSHPEHNQAFNLYEHTGNYAWHCLHHFAHIEIGLSAKGVY